MSTDRKDLPGKPHPAVDPTQTHYEHHSEERITDDLAKNFIKRTQNTLDDTGKLLSEAVDARAAMDMLCDKWKSTWLEFQDTTTDRLRELRMTRMAIDTEMRQLMAGFREVRQFFLDKDYETERARLKEFVEICERLQALKQSGFLDTVADTMLRLGTPEASR